MTTRSTIRSFVCVLLVLSLCAPVLASADRDGDCSHSIERQTFQAASSAVIIAGARTQYGVSQRISPPALFFIVSYDSAASDRGHRIASVGHRLLRSLCTPRLRTGRSPPIS